MMGAFIKRNTGALAFLAAILALLGSWLFGEVRGLQGMLLGLASAGFGVAALVLLVRFLGAASTGGATSPFGSALSIAAFLLKLPLYWVVWTVAQRLGGAAPGCFLTGVCLVYFALVVRASVH